MWTCNKKSKHAGEHASKMSPHGNHSKPVDTVQEFWYTADNFMHQSLELLKKKKRKFLGGSRGLLPRKILKVKTKICAIWGILEADLKKCSTLKFTMNISFVPSVCIHRSIILIFIEKKYTCRFFPPMENIFFRDFPFSFPQESLFLWRIPGSAICKQNVSTRKPPKAS